MKYHDKFWISEDGSYGFGVSTFNTSNWSATDFFRIEGAHDSDRIELACAIDAKRLKERQRIAKMISEIETIETRHFIIDDDGVVELDPDTGEEI